MFQELRFRRSKQQRAVLASFILHGVVILLFVHRAPIFVKASSVAWGMHGKSEAIVYLAQNLQPESSSTRLTLPAKAKRKPPKPQVPKPEALRAGSENGSLDHGPAFGSEAKPALPLVFPDPRIYPWQVANVRGDVVVEITIDERGNVTDTRVLQSLKQEIDQKVVATLRGWHFKPATVDGIAISSRQDVHFHFPS
jgi:TonB family protein